MQSRLRIVTLMLLLLRSMTEGTERWLDDRKNISEYRMITAESGLQREPVATDIHCGHRKSRHLTSQASRFRPPLIYPDWHPQAIHLAHIRI